MKKRVCHDVVGPETGLPSVPIDQNDLLRIINQVRENKHQNPIARLQSGYRLREDLGFESLDLAELTIRIEEKFKLDVFADGMVHTIGELFSKIEVAARR